MLRTVHEKNEFLPDPLSRAGDVDFEAMKVAQLKAELAERAFQPRSGAASQGVI